MREQPRAAIPDDEGGVSVGVRREARTEEGGKMPLGGGEVAGEAVGVYEGGVRAEVARRHAGREGLHVREHAVAGEGHEEGVEAAERGEWGAGGQEEVGEAAEVRRRGGGSGNGREDAGDRNGQGHCAAGYGVVGIAVVG